MCFAQMEVEGLSSSVIQLTNIWLIHVVWDCSATTELLQISLHAC